MHQIAVGTDRKYLFAIITKLLHKQKKGRLRSIESLSGYLDLPITKTKIEYIDVFGFTGYLDSKFISKCIDVSMLF